MPAAVAIPLITAGATAGATLYGANRASRAATRAADTQTAATDRAADLQAQSAKDALGFQREQWEYGKSLMAPYQQMGTQALGTLGNMMGLQGGAPSGGPQLAGGGPMPAGGRSMSLGNVGGSYVAPRMVQMRAPTGEIKAVPEAMVPHLRARGAQVVS